MDGNTGKHVIFDSKWVYDEAGFRDWLEESDDIIAELPDSEQQRIYGEHVWGLLYDEVSNLNIGTEGTILSYGTVGRWDGPRSGATPLGNNIGGAIEAVVQDGWDDIEVYVENGDVRMNMSDHDGSASVVLREADDAYLERLEDGMPVGGEEVFLAATKSIAPAVCNVYGWEGESQFERACRIAGVDPRTPLREQPAELFADIALEFSEESFVSDINDIRNRLHALLDEPLAECASVIPVESAAAVERYSGHKRAMEGPLPEAERALFAVEGEYKRQVVGFTRFEENPGGYPPARYTTEMWIQQLRFTGMFGDPVPDESKWVVAAFGYSYTPEDAESTLNGMFADEFIPGVEIPVEIPYELVSEFGFPDVEVDEFGEIERRGKMRDNLSPAEIAVVRAAAEEGRVATMAEIAAAGRAPAAAYGGAAAPERSRGGR